MTLNGHFKLNFHYYEHPVDKLFYILNVDSVYTRDQRRCAEADRVIHRIFGIRGKLGTLIHKAKISI